MKQKIITWSIILTALILTGCGGGGSGDNSTNTGASAQTTKVYEITVVSDPTLPDSVCKGAKGTMIITDSQVSGTVNSDWGISYKVTGTYVKNTQHIEGGFADGGTQVATFEGNATETTANGTWKDRTCNGIWSGKIK